MRLFHDLFVDVAPEPALVGLRGGDDGVAGALEVLGGVLVLRGVAAADVAAFEAGAEVDPGVAERDAFFADVDLGSDVFGVDEMFAEHRHKFPRRMLKCYQTGCWRDRCGLHAAAVCHIDDADN